MSDNADPIFLTATEAAEFLRVNPRTIFNRIRAGRLPAKRISGGRLVLIDRRDLLSLLENVPTTEMNRKNRASDRDTQEA